MNAEMRWSPIQKVFRSASPGTPDRQKALLMLLFFLERPSFHAPYLMIGLLRLGMLYNY
jgi:hypothetical protein